MITSHHLVMLDIDGTLVHSNDLDTKYYLSAIKEVLGIEFDNDWGRYRNVTDGGILEQVMQENKVVGDHSDYARRVETIFVQRLTQELKREPRSLCEVPGARAFVEYLLGRDDITVSIATGGWRDSALLKLRHVGIDTEHIVVATGSESVKRLDIMQLAEDRALSGQPVGRRIYFGDGEWDQRACRHLQYEFVAVGDSVDHPTRIQNYLPLEQLIVSLAL